MEMKIGRARNVYSLFLKRFSDYCRVVDEAGESEREILVGRGVEIRRGRWR